MVITFSEEINRKFVNFSELEKEVQKTAMEIGREMLCEILEYQDKMILKSRDKARYRSKGLRSTAVVTRFGTVEYRRRVYVDTQEEEGKKHCIFLLDESLAMEKVGHILAAA